MPTRLILVVFTAMLLIGAAARALELGATREAAITALGEPAAATVRDDGVEVLLYAAGEVRLRKGTVCYLRLADPDEDAVDAATSARAAQWRIAELEARLAAMQARVARAEAEARQARARSAVLPWPPAPRASAESPPGAGAALHRPSRIPVATGTMEVAESAHGL